MYFKADLGSRIFSDGPRKRPTRERCADYVGYCREEEEQDVEILPSPPKRASLPEPDGGDQDQSGEESGEEEKAEEDDIPDKYRDPDGLTGLDIFSGITAKKLEIVPVDSTACKVKVWENFGYVRVCRTATLLEGWSACLHCNAGIRFLSKKNTDGVRARMGTSSQQKHLRSCTKFHPVAEGDSQRKITNFAYHKKGISESLQKRLKVDEVKFIAKGNHSFNAVENDGLMDVGQTLINIGAAHGPVPIRDIWYGRRTVRNETLAQAQLVRRNLKNALVEPVQKNEVACTADIWTDDYVKRSYMDMTVYWLDGWRLRRR